MPAVAGAIMSNNIRKGHKPTTIMGVQNLKQGPASDPAQHQQGWADLLSYPSTHPLTGAPPPNPIEKSACPPWKQARVPVVFTLSCYSTSFNKALPGILICPLINFYSGKSPGPSTFIYLITINAEHYGESQPWGIKENSIGQRSTMPAPSFH